MQLSKDRNLEEREKLQLQLSDMNHEMQQQHKTIQVTFFNAHLIINKTIKLISLAAVT